MFFVELYLQVGFHTLFSCLNNEVKIFIFKDEEGPKRFKGLLVNQTSLDLLNLPRKNSCVVTLYSQCRL